MHFRTGWQQQIICWQHAPCWPQLLSGQLGEVPPQPQPQPQSQPDGVGAWQVWGPSFVPWAKDWSGSLPAALANSSADMALPVEGPFR